MKVTHLQWSSSISSIWLERGSVSLLAWTASSIVLRRKVGYVRIKEIKGRIRIEPISQEEAERILRGDMDAGKVEDRDQE